MTSAALRERGESRRAKAKRLDAEGVPRREIARRLKVTLSTVHGYLWRGGTAAPARPAVPVPLIEPGEWVAQFVAGYPDPVRQDWARRVGARWQAGLEVRKEAGR